VRLPRAVSAVPPIRKTPNDDALAQICDKITQSVDNATRFIAETICRSAVVRFVQDFSLGIEGCNDIGVGVGTNRGIVGDIADSILPKVCEEVEKVVS
jgi:hypothetical protein